MLACIVCSIALGPRHRRRPPSSINAVVVDGTGAPRRRASVRIADGRIIAVGALTRARGDRVVDARGLVLAPGFIDTHAHYDDSLFTRPDALPAVSQGITTVVVGQDGGHPHPLADFFRRLDREPAAVNVAAYAGHGTIRRLVLGDDFRRAASAREVDSMGKLLTADLAAGALGLSTGLEYDPGIYSAPDEVLALARTTAAAGGRYISHVRSEDRRFYSAVSELLNDRPRGAASGAALPREARDAESLGQRAQAARAARQRPQDRRERHPRRLPVHLLAVHHHRALSRTELQRFERSGAGARRRWPQRTASGSPRRPTVARRPEHRGDRPRRWGGAGADADAARPAGRLHRARLGAATSYIGIIGTSMAEEDIETILKWPHANVCSDGASGGGHPRGYGAFPRVLGRYVRERKVLPLEAAVRKMTSLSAAHMGFTDRGTIAPGKRADLVLFDPKTVADRATPDESDGARGGDRAGVDQRRRGLSRRPSDRCPAGEGASRGRAAAQ